MNGRRVFHARGKILGGSSQHQRDDLPARQPARLRALGRRPGHGGVGLPPLPALLQEDGDLPRPGADDWRGGDGPLVLERGPATNPLFGAFFEAAQQAGYPLTDDVNGYRQEGFARFDRNVHRGRRLSAARAYLHPVTGPQEPHGRDAGDGDPGRGSGAGGRSGSTTCAPVALQPHGRGRRGDPVRWCHQHPAAAAALRASVTSRCCASRASTSSSHLPGVGENLQDHLEVYIQYASKQPVSIAPGLRWRRASRDRLPSGCSTAAASAPPTTSRVAASPAATTTSTTRT